MPVQLTKTPKKHHHAASVFSNGATVQSATQSSVHQNGADLLVDTLTPGPADSFNLVVNKEVIRQMVQTYRDNHRADPSCLKCIHFNLKELIHLFIDNDAMDATKLLSDQLDNLEYWGAKIYLGNHYDLSTVPPRDMDPNPYLHMDTAIVCNTKLNAATMVWEDQLKDTSANGNSVSIPGAGDGLDRGSICPPNCPTIPSTPGADGYIQQDILP